MSSSRTDTAFDRENDGAPEVYRLADEGAQFQNRKEKKGFKTALPSGLTVRVAVDEDLCAVRRIRCLTAS